MYSINANRVRWTEFTNWFAEQGLVEGQDYTISESVPGWSLVSFERQEDFDAFAQYGGTLTYE
jgi:hypothetical protein